MYFIHNTGGECIGSLVYAEDAAALVSILGDGTTVRNEVGAVLWTEGDAPNRDGNAGDSFDEAADLIREREKRPCVHKGAPV